MEDYKFNSKKEELKYKVKEFARDAKVKARNAANWCYNNKEELAFFVGVGASGIAVAEKVGKNVAKKREEKAKELYKYDHSTGMYVKLRRPLNNKDYENITKRRAVYGESFTEALLALGLVK